ncbi:hypothetical protein DT73_02965 [Mangrovibacter sp. MFB070]|nr:hypothetical protein DT73_02965 [Mangrovibacter sp. MFB070]
MPCYGRPVSERRHWVWCIVALADVAVSMSASSAVVFFMVLSLLSLRVLISPGFSFVLPAKAPCVD